MKQYWIDQLYHFNFLSFILICLFVIFLGKYNMKKEIQKIHDYVEIEVSGIKLMLNCIMQRLNDK